ncbi:hypothetical protein PENTCL1PPCAC_4388, partial [Pristionchus entomophagus]
TGARYGLRVALLFQADEYIPWVESSGVSAYVHPIGQDVYLESAKYTVQPGHVDQLAMKKSTFSRMLSIFTTKCAANKAAGQSFYFTGTYTVDGCLRSCYQDSVYRSCGCMDPRYARDTNTKQCNFEKLACVDAMTAKRGDPYYWPECKCPLPCDEEEYQYQTSRTTLLQNQNITNSIFPTTSEIVIYLGTLDIYAQVEVWKFPFSAMLGATGGFAGVLLGASVVALVDMIVLFMRVAMIGCGSLNALKMKKSPAPES